MSQHQKYEILRNKPKAETIQHLENLNTWGDKACS